jgi:CRP/FNR family transcriptional regulator, cyclic AMP receptor protein
VAKIKPLKENEIFRPLNDHEIAVLSKIVDEKTYPAGSGLFYENMKGEAMYIVVSGQVRLSKMLAEGEERTLTVMGPGDYFGENALLEEGPRTVTAIVSQESVLLVIKRSAFNKLLDEDPKAAVKVIVGMYQVLSTRIRKASPKLQQMLMEAGH